MRRFSITFSTSVPIRVHHEHSLPRETRAEPVEKPAPGGLGQPHRTPQVPAQRNPRIRSVDVLTTRATRSTGEFLDLAGRNPIAPGQPVVILPRAITAGHPRPLSDLHGADRCARIGLQNWHRSGESAGRVCSF